MASYQHLDSNSSPPEALAPGKLRFYAAKPCPFCHRVALMLSYHDIAHERVHINLDDKPQWYLDKLPSGKVPMLEQDGEKLQDSELICGYLDQLHPTRSLKERDTSDGSSVAGKFFRTSFKAMHLIMYEQEPFTDDHKNAIKDGLDILETHLSKQNGPYLSGEELSLNDIMIYPFMERVPVALVMADMDPTSMEDGRPNLKAWKTAMAAIPAVTKESIPFDHHKAFAVSKKANKPDYTI